MNGVIFMNYNTDKPIDNETQDLLGRATFSNYLGESIYKYKEKSGLVIGLFGKWGTGKTSIINMAENKINQLAEHDNHKPLIVKFSPWNYSDKDDLINLFFQNLKSKLEFKGNEFIKEKIGSALKNYADIFDVLSLVPVVGSSGSMVLKTIAKATGNGLIPDLDETKKNLEEALSDISNKIVIIIDDIDRLTNSQIRDIFQLVKKVADFPNVIYILAMDRDIVCSALKDIHNIDGDEYLEKIIQVPFEIPELKKLKVNSILLEKLNVFKNSNGLNLELDIRYWSNVFEYCINPYVNNLRDINRLINTFQFKYSVLYKETAFEDMLAITTLEVLEPKLYKWICNNKDAVCKKDIYRNLLYRNNKPNYRQLYEQEFDKMGIDVQKAINCLSVLFPMFANDVGERTHYYQSNADIRSKMRIAYEERFEVYFSFDLNDVKVSRTLIKDCIFYADRQTLCNNINNINDSDNIRYFLEEVESLINEIPIDRLDLIASVFLELHLNFKEKSSNSIFTIPVRSKANYFIKEVLMKINEESKRYEIIKSAVEKVDNKSLSTISIFLNNIIRSYEQIDEDLENEDQGIINKEHLEELKNISIQKIRQIIKSGAIFDIDELEVTLHFWQIVDNDFAKSYLQNVLKDKLNKLRFICSIASQWTSNYHARGWKFNLKDYKEYIKEDDVYNIIKKFPNDDLNTFKELERIKLASFFLNYSNNAKEYATEEMARKLVDEWNEKSRG